MELLSGVKSRLGGGIYFLFIFLALPSLFTYAQENTEYTSSELYQLLLRYHPLNSGAEALFERAKNDPEFRKSLIATIQESKKLNRAAEEGQAFISEFRAFLDHSFNNGSSNYQWMMTPYAELNRQFKLFKESLVHNVETPIPEYLANQRALQDAQLRHGLQALQRMGAPAGSSIESVTIEQLRQTPGGENHYNRQAYRHSDDTEKRRSTTKDISPEVFRAWKAEMLERVQALRVENLLGALKERMAEGQTDSAMLKMPKKREKQPGESMIHAAFRFLWMTAVTNSWTEARAIPPDYWDEFDIQIKQGEPDTTLSKVKLKAPKRGLLRNIFKLPWNFAGSIFRGLRHRGPYSSFQENVALPRWEAPKEKDPEREREYLVLSDAKDFTEAQSLLSELQWLLGSNPQIGIDEFYEYLQKLYKRTPLQPQDKDRQRDHLFGTRIQIEKDLRNLTHFLAGNKDEDVIQFTRRLQQAGKKWDQSTGYLTALQRLRAFGPERAIDQVGAMQWYGYKLDPSFWTRRDAKERKDPKGKVVSSEAKQEIKSQRHLFAAPLDRFFKLRHWTKIAVVWGATLVTIWSAQIAHDVLENLNSLQASSSPPTELRIGDDYQAYNKGSGNGDTSEMTSAFDVIGYYNPYVLRPTPNAPVYFSGEGYFNYPKKRHVTDVKNHELWTEENVGRRIEEDVNKKQYRMHSTLPLEAISEGYIMLPKVQYHDLTSITVDARSFSRRSFGIHLTPLQLGTDFKVYIHKPSGLMMIKIVDGDILADALNYSFIAHFRPSYPTLDRSQTYPIWDRDRISEEFKEALQIPRAKIVEEIQKIQEVPLKALASRLENQLIISAGSTVAPSDLEMPFWTSSRYTDRPETGERKSILGNPYAPYARFLREDGKLYYQCDGSNELMAELFTQVYKGNNLIAVQTIPSFVYTLTGSEDYMEANTGGDSVVTQKKGSLFFEKTHRRTAIHSPDGENILMLDATPVHSDESSSDSNLGWAMLEALKENGQDIISFLQSLFPETRGPASDSETAQDRMGPEENRLLVEVFVSLVEQIKGMEFSLNWALLEARDEQGERFPPETGRFHVFLERRINVLPRQEVDDSEDPMQVDDENEPVLQETSLILKKQIERLERARKALLANPVLKLAITQLKDEWVPPKQALRLSRILGDYLEGKISLEDLKIQAGKVYRSHAWTEVETIFDLHDLLLDLQEKEKAKWQRAKARLRNGLPEKYRVIFNPSIEGPMFHLISVMAETQWLERPTACGPVLARLAPAQ